MTYAPYEAQKYLYNLIKNDAQIISLVGTKVYDNVPDKEGYPYITIGEATWIDRGSEDTEGQTGTLIVNVWDRYRGRKTVLLIQKRIDELLHGTDADLEGWDTISFRREFYTVVTDPDNITEHGIQRFNLQIGGC